MVDCMVDVGTRGSDLYSIPQLDCYLGVRVFIYEYRRTGLRELTADSLLSLCLI